MAFLELPTVSHNLQSASAKGLDWEQQLGCVQLKEYRCFVSFCAVEFLLFGFVVF